jgi:hypothetical protein
MLAGKNRRWLLQALAGHNGYTRFVELCEFAMHKAGMHVFQPSQLWIARRIGRSRRQVVRLVARAKRHGIIRVERRRWKDGRWRTNRYVVTAWWAVSRMGTVVRSSVTPVVVEAAAEEKRAKAAKRRKQVDDLLAPIGRSMPGCEPRRPDASRRAPTRSRPAAAALPPTRTQPGHEEHTPMIADRPVPGSGTRSPTCATPSGAAHCPSCAMAGIRTHAPRPSDEASKPARSRPGIIVPEPSTQTRAESQAILDKWMQRGLEGQGASPAADAPSSTSATVAPPVPKTTAPRDDGVPVPSDDELAALKASMEDEAPSDDEIARLEAWMEDETVPAPGKGTLAELPPLPKQPGFGASEEQVEEYREAQIRRLKVLGLYEGEASGAPERRTGPPRAAPYAPRRPPLPPSEAKAELKRLGLY